MLCADTGGKWQLSLQSFWTNICWYLGFNKLNTCWVLIVRKTLWVSNKNNEAWAKTGSWNFQRKISCWVFADCNQLIPILSFLVLHLFSGVLFKSLFKRPLAHNFISRGLRRNNWKMFEISELVRCSHLKPSCRWRSVFYLETMPQTQRGLRFQQQTTQWFSNRYDQVHWPGTWRRLLISLKVPWMSA